MSSSVPSVGKSRWTSPLGHNVDWPCIAKAGIATAALCRDLVADGDSDLAGFLAAGLHGEDGPIWRRVQTVLGVLGRVHYVVTLQRAQRGHETLDGVRFHTVWQGWGDQFPG